MPPKTGVKVKLGGKQVTLRFTAPAFVRLENARGGEPLSDTLMKAQRFSMGAIAALVWAGQLHEDEPLSLDEVTNLIEPPVDKLIEGFGKALEPWQQTSPDEGKAEAAG